MNTKNSMRALEVKFLRFCIGYKPTKVSNDFELATDESWP